ncbi:MAG: DUF6285 domain-containing protein [Myxococcota bacterium]|nr:DUF6285 domain-containing protein [Myxococcota bacterium]
MNRDPNPQQILEGITAFLKTHIAPEVEDVDLRFRLRIAIHLLGVAQREFQAGDRASMEALARLAALDCGLPADFQERAPTDASLRERVDEAHRRLVHTIQTRSGQGEDAKVKAHLIQTLIDELRIAQPNFQTDFDIGDDESCN